MCTHLNYSGRCEIPKDICYHSTKYCMSSVCVLQQMAKEPNCRNTEPHSLTVLRGVSLTSHSKPVSSSWARQSQGTAEEPQTAGWCTIFSIPGEQKTQQQKHHDDNLLPQLQALVCSALTTFNTSLQLGGTSQLEWGLGQGEGAPHGL